MVVVAAGHSIFLQSTRRHRRSKRPDVKDRKRGGDRVAHQHHVLVSRWTPRPPLVRAPEHRRYSRYNCLRTRSARDSLAPGLRISFLEPALATRVRASTLNCALKPRHNESVTWPFSEATCQIIGCVYFLRRSRRMSSDVWSLARPWRRFRRNWGLPGSYCMNGVGRGVAMAQPV